MKIGILGAGGIARRRMLPALAGNTAVEVVAVMDLRNAAAIAAEFAIPRYYNDAEALMADAGVEAVYIASPVFLHTAHIHLAANAGKPVFCEKPVARTLAETLKARTMCEEKKIPFMEGYMMNFHGAHRQMQRMITGRIIGRPVSMRAQLSCWYPPIENAWRQDPDMGGGGALIDMATHCFSLLEFLTRDRIVGVFSMTTTQVHSYRSEDSATTLLQFASGCHASVDSFFCVRDESSLSRLEVYGDAGSILAEGTIGQGTGGSVSAVTSGEGESYDATQERKGSTSYLPVHFEEVNPYTAEMEHFAACVSAGHPPTINGWDEAIHIAEVTAAAYASWREGRLVRLPQAG